MVCRDLTQSSVGPFPTTPGAASSVVQTSERCTGSSDTPRSSLASDQETSSQDETRSGYCVQLPQAPKLELPNLREFDPSLQWSNRCSVAGSNSDMVPVASVCSEIQGLADQDHRGPKGSEDFVTRIDTIRPTDEKPQALDAESNASSSSRSSVHLRDMRISQHLRSMSSLSKDSFDAFPVELRHNQLLSVASGSTSGAKGLESERKESFQSDMVPSSWGNPSSRNRSRHRLAWKCSKSNASIPAAVLGPATQHPPAGLYGRSNIDEGYAENQAPKPSTTTRGYMTVKSGSSGLESGTVTESVVAEPKDVCNSSSLIQQGHHAGFGQLRERSRFFSHSPKLRIKTGHRKSRPSFDGTSKSPSRSSQGESDAPNGASVSSNYEQAANVWEKALNTHRLQVVERRTSISRPRNSMSLAAGKASPLSIAIAPDERSDISFKPIETEHSFDRLAVPGKSSLRRARPLAQDSEMYSHPSKQILGRQRSRSQPALRHKDRGRQRSQTSDAPAKRHSSSSSTARLGLDDDDRVRGRPESASGAWSRYPSHTRRKRTEVAGIADGVITKDFAPSSSGSDSDSDLDPAEKKQRQKRRSALVRSALIRRTLLTDLPSFFKPFATGFRRGERGHRSSIAVGGTLEYPELELLPVGESPMSPTYDEHLPTFRVERSESSHSERLTPAGSSQVDRHRSQKQRLASTAASSMYPEDNSYFPGDSQSHVNSVRNPRHLSASDWSRFYGEDVKDIGSDRDGPNEDQAMDGVNESSHETKPLLASTASMPSLRRDRMHPAMRSKLTKSCSVEPVRRSTQNLIELLDRGLEKEIARALRTAEEVWTDPAA